MSELTKEERGKENLIDEIDRALHALEKSSTNACPLPPPTPEEIQSRNKSLKNIADEFLKKADESKKK